MFFFSNEETGKCEFKYKTCRRCGGRKVEPQPNRPTPDGDFILGNVDAERYLFLMEAEEHS